jgi:hypothetical protein
VLDGDILHFVLLPRFTTVKEGFVREMAAAKGADVHHEDSAWIASAIFIADEDFSLS